MSTLRASADPSNDKGARMRRCVRTLVTTMAALAVGVPAAPALAGNLSLTIDGIAGQIDVVSYNVGASRTSTAGGGGAGKPNFQDFSFVAQESAATPLEFLWTSSGFHATSAQLQIFSTGQATPSADWTFSPVLVSSVSIADTQVAPAMTRQASVTLSYTRVVHRVFAADGSVAQQFCYDQVLKQAC